MTGAYPFKLISRTNRTLPDPRATNHTRGPEAPIGAVLRRLRLRNGRSCYLRFVTWSATLLPFVTIATTRGVAMARFENETFENRTVVIDGNWYEGCTFNSCTIEFRGVE